MKTFVLLFCLFILAACNSEDADTVSAHLNDGESKIWKSECNGGEQIYIRIYKTFFTQHIYYFNDNECQDYISGIDSYLNLYDSQTTYSAWQYREYSGDRFIYTIENNILYELDPNLFSDPKNLKNFIFDTNLIENEIVTPYTPVDSLPNYIYEEPYAT